MKPAPFDYARPGSVEEACDILQASENARVLAGGQTLIPMLAMRLSRPSILVDITRIPELANIAERDEWLEIGAATRQAVAERSDLVRKKLPLLSAVLPWVGHPPTRARGTVGGSIANADPSAEQPLVAMTLSAEIIVQDGSEGSVIPADEFFIGPMITGAPAGGLVTAIRFPVWSGDRLGVGFHEVSTRRSDFALVSAAAQVQLDDDGQCLRCAIGVGGVGDVPVRLDTDELIGSDLSEQTVREFIAQKIESLETTADLHASAEYRRRTAGVLARRALGDARENAFEASK
jgi:CO/xanthine dehydrogenase FAD-binding subunit